MTKALACVHTSANYMSKLKRYENWKLGVFGSFYRISVYISNLRMYTPYAHTRVNIYYYGGKNA